METQVYNQEKIDALLYVTDLLSKEAANASKSEKFELALAILNVNDQVIKKLRELIN